MRFGSTLEYASGVSWGEGDHRVFRKANVLRILFGVAGSVSGITHCVSQQISRIGSIKKIRGTFLMGTYFRK